jgi:glycosyltransferase involved in cell wall biosynthesis
VADLIRAGDRPDRVEALGYVEDLPALYQGASALLVTSRAEGFGLPAAEAMACGTPVVAFANTSLVEIVGEGGILVPDGDVASMVKAVDPLLRNERAWDDACARARERGRRFDWDRTVTEHAEVFRGALHRGGR